MSNAELVKQVRTARRVGTPLIGINTPDPAATIAAIVKSIEPPTDGEIGPQIVEWDIVRGMNGLNAPGRDWAKSLGDFDPTIGNPTAALQMALKLEESGLLFIHLASRWFGDASFVQAAWNLRDSLKANGRMVTFLAKCLTLPAELSDDVLVFDEPLPTAEELRAIILQQHKNASLDPDETKTERGIEALRGLSAFCSEQVTAMSLTKSGLNVDGLWDRKRQAVEQTPGLRVFRGTDSFDQIGGCEIIKSFLSRIMIGKARPNAVVFVDEIEKMIGGGAAGGDTSGVSQDQLGTILSYMQDHSAAGCIFVGPPGAAKSAIAKAAGGIGGIPTIQLDLGAAKGSLVGQSEQQLRQMLKVVDAVSNGSSLWIATCNAISNLPPELRRRFTLGTYFFDLPTAAERAAIWKIWMDRYELVASLLPSGLPTGIQDNDWTGAEIRQACDISWRLGCSLHEAAEFVVPVARSAPEKLAQLRDQANGRFLSASYQGVYVKDREVSQRRNGDGSRKLALPE